MIASKLLLFVLILSSLNVNGIVSGRLKFHPHRQLKSLEGRLVDAYLNLWVWWLNHAYQRLNHAYLVQLGWCTWVNSVATILYECIRLGWMMFHFASHWLLVIESNFFFNDQEHTQLESFKSCSIHSCVVRKHSMTLKTEILRPLKMSTIRIKCKLHQYKWSNLKICI